MCVEAIIFLLFKNLISSFRLIDTGPFVYNVTSLGRKGCKDCRCISLGGHLYAS